MGPVLRTLFAHACVVAEVARVGGIIDIVTIFVGGVASGPLRKNEKGQVTSSSMRLVHIRMRPHATYAYPNAECASMRLKRTRMHPRCDVYIHPNARPHVAYAYPNAGDALPKVHVVGRAARGRVPSQRARVRRIVRAPQSARVVPGAVA